VIVFDLDGTLVDSYAPISVSLNHARAACGLPPLDVESVRRRVGRGLEVLIEELVGPDRLAEGVRLFREKYGAVYAEGTFALPDVRETLVGLQSAGYRMGVASNKPARFSDAILQHLGLRAGLGCVLGPDATIAPKPEPGMIQRCLEQLDATPREAVYVGDMVLDVESAARAGLPVLLVPGGSSAAEELRGTGQTLLGSFSDLRTVLTGKPL
jgi:phosphoglycolate phosphatase